jgi:hypothetical protein
MSLGEGRLRGHSLDILNRVLGEFADLSAPRIFAGCSSPSKRPGREKTAADQIAVIGTLTGGDRPRPRS